MQSMIISQDTNKCFSVTHLKSHTYTYAQNAVALWTGARIWTCSTLDSGFRCFLWLYNGFQKLWAIDTRSSFQTPLRVASKTQDLWLCCDTWAESAHIWGPVPLQFSLIKDTRAKNQITKSGPLQKPHLTRTTAENQSDYKEKGENVLFNPNKTEISYIYG